MNWQENRKCVTDREAGWEAKGCWWRGRTGRTGRKVKRRRKSCVA